MLHLWLNKMLTKKARKLQKEMKNPENNFWTSMDVSPSYFQDVMNFSYVLMRPPDGEYGAQSANSTIWTGMVGMLQKNDVDIGKEIKWFHFHMEKITLILYDLKLPQTSQSPWIAVLSSPLLSPSPKSTTRSSFRIPQTASTIWPTLSHSIGFPGHSWPFLFASLRQLCLQLQGWLDKSLRAIGVLPDYFTTLFCLGMATKIQSITSSLWESLMCLSQGSWQLRGLGMYPLRRVLLGLLFSGSPKYHLNFITCNFLWPMTFYQNELQSN